MTCDALSKVILDSAFRVHSALGPGLFENVYEAILAHELRKQNLEVARQVPVPIIYDGILLEQGYRADLIIEHSIIVEIKSVETLLPVHWKQLFTQLKLKDFRLGLLINFGDEHLKNGIRRIANRLSISAFAYLGVPLRETPRSTRYRYLLRAPPFSHRVKALLRYAKERI